MLKRAIASLPRVRLAKNWRKLHRSYTVRLSVLLRAVGVARRCRAGLCFTEEGQSVDFSTLTEVQIRAIVSDPHLKIDEPRLTPVDENIDAEDDATQTEAK